jgi:hypothetical protein
MGQPVRTPDCGPDVAHPSYRVLLLTIARPMTRNELLLGKVDPTLSTNLEASASASHVLHVLLKVHGGRYPLLPVRQNPHVLNWQIYPPAYAVDRVSLTDS